MLIIIIDNEMPDTFEKLFQWILTTFWSKSYNYLQFYEQEVKYIAQSDMTNKW